MIIIAIVFKLKEVASKFLWPMEPKGTQSSFSAHTRAHTHMVYSIIWIGNHQCSVPSILENILRHPV